MGLPTANGTWERYRFEEVASPQGSRNVRIPLSALMPAPVSTNTRVAMPIGNGANSPKGATRAIAHA